MIRGILLDILALVYGPRDADLFSQVLQDEGIQVEPAEVADAMARLPRELSAIRSAIRTEEQESDYHRAMIPLLLENLGVRHWTDAMLYRLVETVYNYPAYFSLYPEVLPVLEELRRRSVALAVVANWAPSLCRLLRELEMADYFAAILASSEVGVAKPDPFLFHRALKQLGLAPEEAIHVGPSLELDVAGAMAASIRPVWLNRLAIPTDHEVLAITDLRGLLTLTGGANG